MLNWIAGIIVAVAVIGGGYWFITGNTNLPDVTNTAQTASSTDTYSTSTAAQTPPAPAPQTTTTTNQSPIMQATLHTTMGDITIVFDPANAPVTSANFIKLAKAGFYDGVKFHRVIKGFMDQAGDPLSKDDTLMSRWGTGGPGYQFADENQNGNNAVGVVSMANAGPNTNGSQFFINAADNTFLNGKYNVFGKVVAGLDVVMAINNVPTDSNDRPVTPVIIKSVELK